MERRLLTRQLFARSTGFERHLTTLWFGWSAVYRRVSYLPAPRPRAPSNDALVGWSAVYRRVSYLLAARVSSASNDASGGWNAIYRRVSYLPAVLVSSAT